MLTITTERSAERDMAVLKSCWRAAYLVWLNGTERKVFCWNAHFGEHVEQGTLAHVW